MEQIPPGGEGKITVTFNTDGYSEKIVYQDVDILTNDPFHPELEVSFQGSVQKFAEINPKRVVLAGRKNESISTAVKIVCLPKYPFKIVKHSTKEGRLIQYRIEEKTENGSRIYLIWIENIQKQAGIFHDVIILKTDSAIRPEIQIPVKITLLE